MANKTLTGAHSLTPESEWGGEGIERVKVRKFVDEDKDSLIGKAKATFTRKTEQGVHSPCLTDGQPHVQQSPGNIPLSFSSPSFIYWPMYYMLWNITLVSGGQQSQLCALPPPCALPASSLVGQCERQKYPWLCALLSSNTPVLLILCTAHIHNFDSYQLLWRKAILS